MIERDIIVNANSNIILAEGHTRGFWQSWKAIALGILLGLLILCLMFVLLLSRPLPVPPGTVFYSVATAQEVERLPIEVREALPSDWQAYANLRSRLPYVFGMYREGESMFSFVVSPLWRVPKTDKIHQTKKGLVMLAADTRIEAAPTRSYWSFLFERWKKSSPVLAMQPAEILGIQDDTEKGWIVFSIKKGMLRSSFVLPKAPDAELNDADISLHLNAAMNETLRKTERIPYFPAADRLARLPNILRADIRIGELGAANLIELTFEQPLTESEAGTVLGAYGFTTRKLIVLPDGTTSFERMEPVATEGISLLGPRKDEQGRMANITGPTFTFVNTSSTGELLKAPACSSAPSWLRLSSKTVSALAQRFGLSLDANDVRPLRIISEKERLGVCFE